MEVETRGNNIDYRQVFTSLLKNWFEAPDEVINNKVMFSKFNKSGMLLDIVTLCNSVGVDDFVNTQFKLFECSPNPAKSTTTIRYYINSDADVKLILTDIHGRQVKEWVNSYQVAGI